jgi:integrase
MRLKNLAGLELDRHLRRSGNGRHARWFVVIPGVEVKNGEALELPLPERTVLLLEAYRARVLPVLAEQPEALWLFPGQHGAKREVTLGPQIGKLLRRELGCQLSPHQFRHLCGYLYLQRHPHGHEVVRAMLGHRSIATTLRFYAGLEGIAAARHYDAMLQELVLPPPRPRRRPRR